MNDIKVSIVCNTYNHEKYIRDALEGFVSQKTNFKFEVLIHDDASTDKTADIIREYETKYPDIIKPIYQIENQYSKGIKISMTYQYPRVSGRYIALCEGDDYWIDPLKLQKQFDLMEQHPEVDICAHDAKILKKDNYLRKFPGKSADCLFSVEEVIEGGGGFVSTNSLFFRRELNKNIPDFRQFLELDYTLQIQGTLRGGMLYMGECMSVYRYQTPGSWTVRNREPVKRINHHKKMLEMFKILDRDTNGDFHSLIESKVDNIRKSVLLICKYNNIKIEDECAIWYKQISFFEKCKMNIMYYLHLIKKFLKKF